MQSIIIFGLALEGNNYNYQKIVELGAKTGYIIDPHCATKEVADFLQSITIHTNSTFYQNRESIRNNERFTLFLDQITHYATTYGTNHEGSSYIPNQQYGREETIDFTQYKYIKATPQKEIIQKCDDMLASGIALHQDTLNGLFEIYDRYNNKPNIESIKNKEAMCIMCERFDLQPTNNDEFVRYLIYLATKKTLLIKDKKTLQTIEVSGLDITKKIPDEKKLSECFLRHKPIFLAFKKANKNNAPLINRLRKYAIKNHKPLKQPIMYDKNMDITKLTNFQKVSIIEGILNKGNEYKNFIIRNGTFWIDQNTDKQGGFEDLYFDLYNSLVIAIRKKHTGKIFYMPEGLEITVPKSEKTFVGDFPFGTKIKKQEDMTIGIYWRGEDGGRDFDLSVLDENLVKIGRNASYNNDGFVYSGDITIANPDACELIKMGLSDCLIQINNFSSTQENPKYEFFVGKSTDIEKGKMIDTIVCRSSIISEKKEQILGVQVGGDIIIQKLSKSNKTISNGDTITKSYLRYYQSKKFIYLRKLLKDAGFIEGIRDNCDIDFSNLSKNTIIEIIS